LYKDSIPRVCESYSNPSTEINEYHSKEEILLEIEKLPKKEISSLHLSIYYPESKGAFIIRKITLNPDKCNGHTFRFSSEGWEVIYIRFHHKYQDKLECNISVNSIERALVWCGTTENMGDPNLWDWKIVNRQARRLIRILRKFGENEY
jgi:hypothetical protein